MTNYTQVTFNSRAVRPTECLKEGWELIRGQYWLFVGMSLVCIIIASLVPFGILLGPMMCGIYMALFRAMRREPVDFGTAFRGFDYFGQSLVATLIHMAPIFAVLVPTYIAFYIGLIFMIPQSGGQPDPSGVLWLFIMFGVAWFFIIVFITVISILFTFTYPLIVDRGLSGVEAVKLSARAALANFWRLLGLYFLSALLGIVGVLLCYVGVFLVMPVTFAALAVAYRDVFGLGGVVTNLPPPPPTFH